MKQKNSNNIAIGARIKQVRKHRNITQEKLAEMINLCDGQRISEIERGVSSLSIAKFKELCKALDV